MESGLASDEVAVVFEGDASLGDDGIEVFEGVEVLVDDGFVDVGPEGFGGLQLRRVGRQEDEADAFGDGERLGVPAGAVEDEDDDPVASGAGLAGEEREGVLEELLVDAGREVPEALAGCGRDEGGDVEPFEPVMAAGDRALAARRPDPAQDRLQSDPVLVGGEDLDCRAGMALGLLGDGLREPFLKASCSSGVAASACCGRGLWIVQPIARKRLPAALLGHARAPSSAAMKAATFFAVQTPPSSGGRLQPLPKRLEHLRGQHRRRRAVAAPTVAEARRPEGIVARQQLLDPARREARQPGHLGDRSAPAPAARSPGSAAPASRHRCCGNPPCNSSRSRCPRPAP